MYSKVINILIISFLYSIQVCECFIPSISRKCDTAQLKSFTMKNIAEVRDSDSEFRSREKLNLKPLDGKTFPSPTLLSTIVTATITFAPLTASAVDDISAVLIARPVIDTFVNVLSFLFLCQVIISWYPKTDVKVFPYNVVSWTTEPL